MLRLPGLTMLLAKAAEHKLLRTDKVRADTTVVQAAVAYPTDSGLLAKAVSSIASTITRIQAAGGATRTRVRDRSRSAGSGPARSRPAASARRRGTRGGQAAVLRITGELAGIAESTMRDAQAVLRNARRRLRTAIGRRCGQLRRAVNDLDERQERHHHHLLRATADVADPQTLQQGGASSRERGGQHPQADRRPRLFAQRRQERQPRALSEAHRRTSAVGQADEGDRFRTRPRSPAWTGR